VDPADELPQGVEQPAKPAKPAKVMQNKTTCKSHGKVMQNRIATCKNFFYRK